MIRTEKRRTVRCRETNMIRSVGHSTHLSSRVRYSAEVAGFISALMPAVGAPDGAAVDMIGWATGQRESEIHF